MIELDKVKFPFASKHCIQSSYISIKKQTLKREPKEDDFVIKKAQRKVDDEEPETPGLDSYGQYIRCEKMFNDTAYNSLSVHNGEQNNPEGSSVSR